MAGRLRTFADRQVAEIAASTREFGWTNSILADGDNGFIAGHGRPQAARKLSMTDVLVIDLARLSEAQKRALVLADSGESRCARDVHSLCVLIPEWPSPNYRTVPALLFLEHEAPTMAQFAAT